jgi:ankyrin repeat protein
VPACQVRASLAAGVDPSGPLLSVAPLSLASAKLRPRIVALLLEARADPNGTPRWVPLLAAAEAACTTAALKEDAVRVCELLLEARADLTASTSGGWSALRVAALAGNAPVVELLLRRGVPGGDLALKLAVRSPNCEQVRQMRRLAVIGA